MNTRINKKKVLNIKIETFLFDEIKNLNDGENSRYKMFLDFFQDIDGLGTSLRERSKLKLDDFNYCYGEIEYIGFVEVCVLSNIFLTNFDILYIMFLIYYVSFLCFNSRCFTFFFNFMFSSFIFLNFLFFFFQLFYFQFFYFQFYFHISRIN